MCVENIYPSKAKWLRIFPRGYASLGLLGIATINEGDHKAHKSDVCQEPYQKLSHS